MWTILKRIQKKISRPSYLNVSSLFDHLSEEENLNSMSQKINDEIEKIINELNEDKQNLSSIYQKEEKYIEDSWSRCKLDMIPGDLLLDKICKEYGVRFKKSTDGSRLASFMNKNDIDPEIESLIKEIGKSS